MKDSDGFIPENLVTNRSQIQYCSPSGRYELRIDEYCIKKGCWHCTKGTVLENGRIITIVYRNYPAFPFCFLENHLDGHDYLFCGEDYQGQTVIQLDTGVRKEYLKKGMYSKGICFCWASIGPVSPSKTKLVVEGCHWACPYEVRIFDISNPLEKLPCVWNNWDYENFSEWIDENNVTVGRPDDSDDLEEEKEISESFIIDYSKECETEIAEEKRDRELLEELEKKQE